GRRDAVNPAQVGTKAAAHFHLSVPAGGEVVIKARLTNSQSVPIRVESSDTASGLAFEDFDSIFEKRVAQADEFYSTVIPQRLSEDARNVMRQALAGML